MKTMILLYALSILAVIGIGLYNSPWWLIVGVLCPMGVILASCLLDDHKRLRERNGGVL